MPPNIIDPPIQADPEFAAAKPAISHAIPDNVVEENDNLKIFQSSLSLIAHILIGVVTGISILFSLRNGLPIGATPLHIILCVIGYQLLMAQAIIILSSESGWSSRLKLVHKRRIHWIVQIVGFVLAIVGSFIKILDKNIHWNTYHGQFALVAMVFTAVSLVNGLTSLYAYELRKFLPSNLSKLSHICFGTVAFAASSISLCYGFDKSFFINWATLEFTYTIIAFTAAFTFIIIINPFITFYRKSRSIITS